MSISAIAAQKSSATTTSSTKDSNDLVSQEEFLKLLVTQLQNQDPLNPSDTAEFTSQLTQFSSLEQLINMNSGLDTLAGIQNQTSLISASGFIGQQAQVTGDALTIQDGSANAVYYDLARDSTATTMNVYDANDNLVAVVDLGRQSAGEKSIQWNGHDANGDTVADGSYHFEIVGQDAQGTAIDANTSFNGLVSGVRYTNDGTMLIMNGKEYPLSNMIGVTQ